METIPQQQTLEQEPQAEEEPEMFDFTAQIGMRDYLEDLDAEIQEAFDFIL